MTNLMINFKRKASFNNRMYGFKSLDSNSMSNNESYAFIIEYTVCCQEI